MSVPIITRQYEGGRHFNKYCREHRGRVADPHDHAHKEFFDEINNSRDTYFDSSLELYTGLVLRDRHGFNKGFVDFAQEGLVAKLHINATLSRPSTLKRARSRKNAQLRLAQSFFEEITRHPFRTVRIDKVYESGVWQVRTVDVTDQNSPYRKL